MAIITDNSVQSETKSFENVAQHVAIIMDGNGRWAKKRGLPRAAGHQQGTENVRQIIRASVDFGVKILTIYAFSTENWNRPKHEVNLLMQLLNTMIDRELAELHENGVQIRHIGEPDAIPKRLQKKIAEAVEKTKDNQKLILNVALNYGGRDEIIRAVQAIVRKGIPPEAITEETLSAHLYTSDLRDPDLIIRTSGELRISNFLIWQGAYSEHYYTDVLWPDFDRECYRVALEDYATRRRRFGKTDEQIDAEKQQGS